MNGRGNHDDFASLSLTLAIAWAALTVVGASVGVLLCWLLLRAGH